MRLPIRSLVAAAALLFAVEASSAKAQSAGDYICDSISYELSDVAASYDLAAASVDAWCLWFIEPAIESLIPWAFDLGPSDVHPSEISKLLDRETPYYTAWQYNDRLYFSDADYLYSASYRGQSSCYGTTCYLTDPVSGRTTRSDMSAGDFSGRGIQWTVFGEKHGLTLVKRESRTTGASGTDYDWTGYGAWATHNAFFSRWQEGVDGLYEGSGQVWSYSAGDASNSNPPLVYARWNGLMAGIDVSNTSTRGNPVLGNATILFDGRYYWDTVDVSFTDILDTKTLDSHYDMHWYDLGVYSGSFAYGSDSNSIQGEFYGWNHEEVGGIFEANQISGSFGATRQ